MAELNIRVFPDPILREKTQKVTDFGPSLQDLLRDLWDTMFAKDGVGLAAPQVGILLDVIVISYEDHRYVAINPRIVEEEGAETAEEGCLSFPGIYEKVVRPQRVVVEAQDESGKPYRVEASGFLARIFSHEIDHLHGKLLIDHLSPIRRQFMRKKLKRERAARK